MSRVSSGSLSLPAQSPSLLLLPQVNMGWCVCRIFYWVVVSAAEVDEAGPQLAATAIV